jgi:hypothetical protein
MDSNELSKKETVPNAISRTKEERAPETLEPVDVMQPQELIPTSKFKQPPTCNTENPLRRDAKLQLGLYVTCSRWVPGSVIRWAAFRTGFGSLEDANFAAQQLHMAAKNWNDAKIGVTFEWVESIKDAAFVLCYGGDGGTTLAEAFFPNSNRLNTVYIYSQAFDKDWRDNMRKVFTHELGHVLGLRHEFAMDPDPNRYEGEAEQWGPRNPMSVMNYREEPPEIQQSDIVSTKMYYALTKDANGKLPTIGSIQMIEYIPHRAQMYR